MLKRPTVINVCVSKRDQSIESVADVIKSSRIVRRVRYVLNQMSSYPSSGLMRTNWSRHTHRTCGVEQ